MEIWGTSRDLLAQFEVGQNSEGLYARYEVGQNSAELLGKAEVQQSGSVELFGKADVTHSIELLGRAEVQQSGSAELLGKTEIQQPSSSELLGECNIVHSTELLCNAIIKNVCSAVLYARAEVGQDSRDLFAKFEAQDTQVLYAKVVVRQADLGYLHARAEVGQGSAELFGKFEAQATAELLGKFEAQATAELLGKFDVGQGSAELLGKGDVQQSGSAELLGKFEAQATAEFLGRAVIGHPALPAWLKAIFSIGLTNTYRDLGSSLEIGRSAFAELLGKFEAQATAELLGKGIIRHPDTAELLGEAVIRREGTPVELLGKADIRGLSSANLNVRLMIIGPAKGSDTYISFFDPSDWINEVVGVGQGFIAIPWVEADAVVKTSGNSSARLTSTYVQGEYKEIRFGWGGMNWGVEAAVSPEVAPTPIDTGGRGPRRGSRASRDQRREVPQSSYKELKGIFTVPSYKELKGIFTVNALPSVVSQLRDIADADGWWQNPYPPGSAFLLIPNADGTLTLRSHFAAGSDAVGGGAYGTNKSFIPTAGNPVILEWEIQCNAPVVGGTTYSFHFLGGLTDGRTPWSGTNEITLFYDGDIDEHVLDIYEDGVESYNGAWTAVDITDKIKFKLVWEHPDDVAPNGRIRIYIDDVLTFTETTVVPETELCFFFGVFLLRSAGTPTAEATLHSIAEL